VVLVAVQLSVLGSYLPPVFKSLLPSYPPQTTISLPVQTAVWCHRPVGTLVELMTVQLSRIGLYLAPLFNQWLEPSKKYPPQTIISLPVHTAVCPVRDVGALVLLMDVQISVTGLYLPPVFNSLSLYPPQTIISLPVQTAVCSDRAVGALVVLMAVQLSDSALYFPPVFR
jgi:hypothetical protein